jgi:hypothetical protein
VGSSIRKLTLPIADCGIWNAEYRTLSITSFVLSLLSLS